MIGTGREHWPTVHVADMADVFRRVPGRRLCSLLPRHRQRRVLDRRRTHRRRPLPPSALRGRPRIRRRGAGPPRRLLRRNPPARSRHQCSQSSLRTRMATVPRHPRRRVPPRQLLQIIMVVNGPQPDGRAGAMDLHPDTHDSLLPNYASCGKGSRAGCGRAVDSGPMSTAHKPGHREQHAGQRRHHHDRHRLGTGAPPLASSRQSQARSLRAR
jgi:hypothetical protein